MAVSDTLRGFRTQFLYTIHRVVTDCDPEYHYVPEGIEDLDIKKNGQIVETIQVKNKKGKLQSSKLYSPSGTTSFFKRALETISDNNEATIRLVSFSNVSPDLQDANSLNKYLAKSKDKDVKKKAKLLSNSYCVNIVNEDSLYDEIVYVLKQNIPTFNPDKELRYLLQWVYENAENHQEFTYNDLIKELNCYKAFENRQSHALNELGLRIIPLFQESIDLDVDVLKKGFYSGLSAKSEHVLLDLDVPRPDKMEAIKSAFKEQNVVIINGASGQGKSVLSYRYIKDNCVLAYEITSCDRNSLASLQASLNEICNGLSVPILLYFDAKPADAAWVELIQAFSKLKNVRCLISLRNEDWNQYRSRLGSDVLYKDIELFLSKEEAHHIYDYLCTKTNQTIGSFETAWEKLGEKVALLEFVYYITQGQALKDKLVSQWKVLPSLEKSFFEVIITANYFGGKIDRNLHVLYCGHSYSVVQEAIDNYLGEFFVEDENGLLDAVHPLRTAIIAESIYNNNKQDMNNKAIELYFKSDISDAHLYLLNLFKNGLTIKELYDASVSQTVLSGKQFAGIVRAMIWKGTENYLSDVQPLIDKLRKEVGGLWEFYLPVNFTEIDIKQSLNNLLNNFPNKIEVSDIVDSFPAQDSIYIHLNNYLDNQISINLLSNEDWVIVADALYRISLSKHPSRIHLSGQIDASNLLVDEASKILLGLKSLGLKRDCWKSIEDSFVEKLRMEYLLMTFLISESSIEATTFMRYTTDENSPVQKTKDLSTNSHIVRIVGLLRMAFPEKINYHVKLGKDALSTMAIDKEKNIQKTNLPIDAMHEIRSCVVNQYKNNIGILDKAEYVEKLIAFRQELTIANRNMVSIFAKWWKTGRFDSTAYMNVHQCFVSAGSNIPQPSYVSSNIFGYGDIKDIPQNTSWDLFMKEFTSYVSNLSNFYAQLPKVLIKKENYMPSKACLFDALLAIRCLQIKYKELFSSYIPNPQKYETLEKLEYNNLLSLWVIWETQCRNLKGMDFTSQMKRYKQMEDTLPKSLIDDIKSRFTQEGIACDAQIANNNFNIFILFKTEAEYNKATDMVDCILKDTFSKYTTYTSQEYILRNTFENIKVQFLFVSNKGTHHRINSLISSCDVRHMLNQSSKDNAFSTTLLLPEYLPVLEEKLRNYEKVIGLATSILVIIQQLLSMHKHVSNNDKFGEIIIEKYEEECIAECRTYKDSIAGLKTSLSTIADNPWHSELNRMIYLLEKVLDTNNLLIMFDEIDTLTQSIFSQDIKIRLALLNNFKNPT